MQLLQENRPELNRMTRNTLKHQMLPYGNHIIVYAHNYYGFFDLPEYTEIIARVHRDHHGHRRTGQKQTIEKGPKDPPRVPLQSQPAPGAVAHKSTPSLFHGPPSSDGPLSLLEQTAASSPLPQSLTAQLFAGADSCLQPLASVFDSPAVRRFGTPKCIPSTYHPDR
jgi:hypothetical protein